MTIDKQALLVSKAKASVFTMRYISQFEASDIDSDDIDLRFEVDGTETGTTVSIVDECGHAAQIITALLDENIQLQRGKDALEAVALALRDDMRDAREKLEAAERSMAEQSAIVAAAEKLVRCKGRYHSELNYRTLAKLFGVITPDLPPLVHENVHYADAAEVEITALRQRIAELEARTVNLSKLSVGEVMHLSGFSRDYAEGWCAGNDNAIHEIRTAGIKVKGE
ncbi:ead/Ea22-like family protein [Salmonella enterica]|nr:ead/Ea22-like family protein [Salmonella enterica]EAY7913980.1 ead/Ea22-like family protein [Salmonella enterica]ECH3907938.1 ead/Ea22-like family protein [Salmonella enterica]ECK3297595.1 ead/Ea22-like family protein [Salmonella enterica]EEJ1083304.1 ead/Ea22-like family protein [Salmonella enterica]